MAFISVYWYPETHTWKDFVFVDHDGKMFVGEIYELYIYASIISEFPMDINASRFLLSISSAR